MSSLSAAAPLVGSGLLGILPCRSGPASAATVNSGAIGSTLWAALFLSLSSVLPHVRQVAGGGRGRRGGGAGAAGGGGAAAGRDDAQDPPPANDNEDNNDEDNDGGGDGDGSDKDDDDNDDGRRRGGGKDDDPPPPGDDSDDDYSDDDEDDEYDGKANVYRSPFHPREVSRVQAARPVIRGFYVPPGGSPLLRRPAPFDVVGDTRYARVQAKVHGKAAHELEFVYNVCAWVQALHNRILSKELEREEAGKKISSFDRETRLWLHQLFSLTSARYKVISLATHDGPASETLRALVFDNADDGVYCPAWDFLQNAQTESFVKQAARRHGTRHAAGIRADNPKPPDKPGKGDGPKRRR